MNDKRAYPRKVVVVRIDDRTEFGILTHTTENLSRQGMFITTDAPYPEGTTLDLTIALGKNKINVQGRVVWRKSADNSHGSSGMGVVIIEISPEDQEILDEFLNRD
ncbi:MAG: PilZ domain-containing protein [Deltaproteobacteria bacterium]|nr:PilZ domain-containing protein [Deltaproteobacteria bacterium]MBW2052890.1 PilZ domain-containing protein [Deltaproteobacteria bacterium]MBW2141406.1 PilZ domain-containing protein [Deltaproteobacteria bacterium]MBW2324016.1 PilZ domain-containing protein [Deltaproteobacteria bacterium]